jgi:type IV pilus assembly protein PilB
MTAPRRLGELLVSAGLITEGDLATALEAQKKEHKRLGELLVGSGVVSEIQLTQVLSNQLSVAWVSLNHVDFTRELLGLVPREVAAEHTLIPVHFRVGKDRERILYVAMDDPTHVEAMEAVSELTSMHVRPLIAPPSEIRKAIETQYDFGEAS